MILQKPSSTRQSHSPVSFSQSLHDSQGHSLHLLINLIHLELQTTTLIPKSSKIVKMKYTAALLIASAAFTSAQVTYNATTGKFICPANAPNGNFCASSNNQETNIIIRCTNGVGQPGNCNDNLAGRPPTGVRYSPCFETNNLVGDAACSRK